MRMSRKLMILFSLLALVTTAANYIFYYTSKMESMYEGTQEMLLALGDKIQDEIEQYVLLMDYAMAELTCNVEFMNAMHVASTRADQEDIGEMMAAQTLMSRILYQEPLMENFYRVSVYARNSFFLTSHFEKTDSVVSMSDEAEETIASLEYLETVDAHPLQSHLIGPHIDPWSSTRSVPVFSSVRAMVFHGGFIGYVEVSAQLEDLIRIFTIQNMEGVQAHAFFDNGEPFFLPPGDTVGYTALNPNGMTRCKMEDGSERLVVKLHSKPLGIDIYVSQDLTVFNQEASYMLMRYTGVSLIILFVALMLVMIFSLQLTRSIRKLTKKVLHLPVGDLLENSEGITTMVSSSQDQEIYQLEKVFNGLMARLQVALRDEISIREGALQAQLNALQTQINPHFIYNTLNIISAKGMECGNEEIIEICDQFAQMLRYSTDVRSRTATLGEELQNARRYLLLAKARYEDNLHFEINIPKQMESVLIPKLTLQPIVENALVHGFVGASDIRVITITGTVKGDALRLIIHDNGKGYAPDMLEQLSEAFRQIDQETRPSPDTANGHIGLINTYLRLHYYSLGKMRMTLRNDNGAVVELTLPCERRNKDV